jgi:hypothetical protein
MQLSFPYFAPYIDITLSTIAIAIKEYLKGKFITPRLFHFIYIHIIFAIFKVKHIFHNLDQEDLWYRFDEYS